eukprot:CAMPEP_0116870592 /NCGR_PEP_ID=MMETSP0463-20121206/555_1 /TAXON_ID=181622 /ORGANISM="Strombidinopsis sp, Strain SopsisLIS2011" /LENGTH=104 /DNA_ID=CAMNT_0004507393 /DNA_START=222 /DNA_END=536 /DNA_ORIENTATION=+
MEPDNVVLEMCDDRYKNELYEIMASPTYSSTLQDVHQILDTGNFDKLLDYPNIAVDQGNFELLIGLDQCSYRMACKSIFGDRSIMITEKRYHAKLQMLKMYQEA